MTCIVNMTGTTGVIYNTLVLIIGINGESFSIAITLIARTFMSDVKCRQESSM